MSDTIFPDDLVNVTPDGDDKIIISDTSDLGETKIANISDLPVSLNTQLALDNKVDKITGKGLSTNDYDNIEKGKVSANTNKLLGIEEGAEVNITEQVIPGNNITITRVGKDITINSLGGPAVVTNGFNRNYFTATGGQTIFNLTFTYTVGTGSILVFVNGNITQPTIAYNETNGNTITFLEGLDAGDIVQVLTGVKGDNGDGESINLIGGININIDDTDPLNPIINWDGGNYYTQTEVDNISISDRNRANHTGTQTEETLSFSDITTGNATTLKHGFLPKLSGNNTQFLDGLGNYTTPAGIVNSYSTTTFTNQTTVTINHGLGAFPIVQVLGNSNQELIPNSIIHNSVNQITINFVIATTGTVILSVGSPQASNLTTVNSDYQITNQDNIIKCNTIGITVTLPTAIGFTGLKYIIDNATIGDVFIEGSLGQTIQSEIIQTLPTNSSITLYSDGANWRFI